MQNINAEQIILSHKLSKFYKSPAKTFKETIENAFYKTIHHRIKSIDLVFIKYLKTRKKTDV